MTSKKSKVILGLVAVVVLTWATSPNLRPVIIISLMIILIVWWRRWSGMSEVERSLRRGWPNLAEQCGLGRRQPDGKVVVPGVVAVTESTLGWEVKVQLLTGQEPANVTAVAGKLRAAWDVREVRVRDQGRCAAIDVVTRDLLAVAIEPTIDMVPTAVSLDAVPAGVCEDGTPWTVPIDGGSMVIGGVPRGGKSVTIAAILAGLAGRPDVQIVAIDMKAMIELGTWEPRCAAAAGDQESALEILREVDNIRRDRQEFVRKSGMTSLSRIGYSREMPYILVVIDECAELFAAESTAKEAKERAAELIATTSRIVRLGRASGVGVLAATQRPTVDSLPGVIRDNAAHKIATRCTTPDQAKAILGESAAGGVSPTQIGPGQPGVAVTDTGAGQLVRVRSAFLSEEVRREVVRRTAHLARPLADLAVMGCGVKPHDLDDALADGVRQP